MNGGRRHRPLWLLFALPALALYVFIVLLPTLGGLPLSLSDWDGVSTPRFRGLSNFGKVLHSQEFASAMAHTAIVLGIFLALTNTVGLGLAVLLNQRPAGYRVYQAVISFRLCSRWSPLDSSGRSFWTRQSVSAVLRCALPGWVDLTASG